MGAQKFELKTDASKGEEGRNVRCLTENRAIEMDVGVVNNDMHS
jgi:hypothetical protein